LGLGFIHLALAAPAVAALDLHDRH
jgi:hypothetical protein